MGKYRLTILFALTAVAVIALASIVVNHGVGNLAEDNLIRIAEEDTARDAVHMEAMMRRRQSADHIESIPPTDLHYSVNGAQNTMPLTIEFLAGPGGLPLFFPMLTEGLNLVKFNLFDLNGTTVWSTDPGTIGITNRESPLYGKAVKGDISSKLVKDHEVVHLDGVVRPVDVVETYLPLREARGGNIVGAIEIYRDVSSDVALQVDDAKSVVFWTTVVTMSGLFLVLLGFIVVADVSIIRSRRRELAVAEEANQSLEVRVGQRTRELGDAITRLVDAQAQLVRTEKLAAIGQLAGSVAHDLRNPLGAINNAIYYLKKKRIGSEPVTSNPKIGQFFQIVEDEVEHSNKIITDLLTFARVNKPSLSPADIKAMIESALSTVEIKWSVQVIKQFDPELPEVRVDNEQIHRVFTNLLTNAQDAMPDGGELTISAQRVNGFVDVTFEDTGTGISDQDMGKIFEPLFTTKARGTGLGLSVCQQMISNHGGTINVASQPGEGAAFTVRLPTNGDGP